MKRELGYVIEDCKCSKELACKTYKDLEKKLDEFLAEVGHD